MSESKSKLRELTIGKKPEFKKEIVEWEGQEFEIREPSVFVRGQIMNKSGMNVTNTDNPDINFSDAQIASVIYCTYVPETDERVFSEKDVPMLREQPSGSFVDEFSRVAMRLMNREPEEQAKN